jgi:hydroxypyruvate isomerase
MPRFCANLSLLFTEAPLAQRLALAAQAGFKAVEIQFPYQLPASTLAKLLHDHDLTLVMHNLPAGDWSAGDRGIACDPRRRQEFLDAVGQGIDYATHLGVGQLNCLAGIAPANLTAAPVRDTLLSNLDTAASLLDSAGIELLLEPINCHEVPGFVLNTSSQALAIMDELNHANIRLQFDLYHATRMHENIPQVLTRHLPRIGHIQFADVPGRHQPGTGTIHFDDIFGLLDRLGYHRWIGAEYLPSGTTQESLDWFVPASAVTPRCP